MPSLAPVSKCSRVPRHYCHRTFVPRLVKKPIIIKWCIEDEVEEEEEEEEGDGGSDHQSEEDQGEDCYYL